jgi:hypothetical protein
MGVDLSPLIPVSTEEQEEAAESKIKKYVHIVSPPENVQIFSWLVSRGNSDPSAQDIVNAAREHGWQVTALCGYKWIPTSTGENLDACQICMDVAGMHMRNAGE